MSLRGLYAITPEGVGRSVLLQKVEAAMAGGIALLQYRRKPGTLQEAREVVSLGRRYAVPVIVNDDLTLALEAGADGVHLGREDGDLAAARRRLGSRLLGASCYGEPALARQAVRAGADYVAFGSVFASPTKPDAVRAPLSLFAQDFGVPLCAIGGITLGNASEVIRAGARLLAVITDLFDAPDVAVRAAQYRELFR